MKKFTYLSFLKGENVTIREVLEKTESPSEGLTKFIISLHQTDEKIKITIENKFACMVKPNASLFYADYETDTKGCIFWKNGFGPFGITL